SHAQDKQDDKASQGQQDENKDAKKPGNKKRTGGLRVPVGRVPKNRQDPAADPLKQAQQPAPGGNQPFAKAQAKGGANANPNPNQPQVPLWPFHYTLKLEGTDGTPLSAAYYPARASFEAPVLIMLHESGAGRSGKEFAEPIEDLKGRSFTRY